MTALISARCVKACGKLPQMTARVWVEFLGVEQQRAREAEQLLA